MNNAKHLLAEFEHGNMYLLTREELIFLVAHLSNNIKQMSSKFEKILSITQNIPCKEYIVSEGVNGKQLKLIYYIPKEFIKNELEKYDFHILTKKEEEK